MKATAQSKDRTPANPFRWRSPIFYSPKAYKPQPPPFKWRCWACIDEQRAKLLAEAKGRDHATQTEIADVSFKNKVDLVHHVRLEHKEAKVDSWFGAQGVSGVAT